MGGFWKFNQSDEKDYFGHRSGCSCHKCMEQRERKGREDRQSVERNDQKLPPSRMARAGHQQFQVSLYNVVRAEVEYPNMKIISLPTWMIVKLSGPSLPENHPLKVSPNLTDWHKNKTSLCHCFNIFFWIASIPYCYFLYAVFSPILLKTGLFPHIG